MVRTSAGYGPIKARQKPVNVEAFQFRGWATGEAILRWLPTAYYVGRGFEHSLRRKNEYDRSNHHILDDAPEFLVIREEGEQLRIDLWNWIVLTDDHDFLVLSSTEFEAKYDKVDEDE